MLEQNVSRIPDLDYLIDNIKSPPPDIEIQWNLYYPTLYYPNFQLSDLQSTLPTPFKPVILGFPLSDLIVTPPRGADNGGSTVLCI